MKVYTADRQTGKTTKLVKVSASTGAIIVTATHQMCQQAELVADKLGLKIPTPITVSQYISRLANGGLGKTQKYLVDELQMVLSQMNVEAATLDSKYVESISINTAYKESSEQLSMFYTALSEQLSMLYTALDDAGFTNEQAFELIKAYVTKSVIKNIAMRGE